MARLAAADLDARDVSRVLTVLHAGFGRIEPLLIEHTWYRPQAASMAADLAQLPQFPMLPFVHFLALRSRAAQLGAAYVLVGSRLGARSISARLGERMGQDFIRHSQYYGAEAAHAAEQWKLLLSELQAGGDEENAAESAVATFEHLIALSMLMPLPDRIEPST